MARFLCIIVLLLGTLIATESGAIDRWKLSKILSLSPPNGPPSRYGDVIYRPDKTSEMAPVVFSHALHRTRHTCRVCHLELDFALSRKKSGVSRSGNLGGHYCGTCHDGEIAFSVKQSESPSCNRCHQKNRKEIKTRFKEVAADLPASKSGNRVDWNAAIEFDHISPVDTLYGEERLMKLPAKLKKPLELGTTAPRSGVLFSHQAHLEWLDCSNCHPQLFEIAKMGTTNFSMEKTLYGFYCGTCHMRVAFPVADCNRCHPQMKSRTNTSFY